MTHAETTSILPTSRWRSLWQRWRWFAPAAALIVVLRARLLFTPITADEAGYLGEARAWGRGAVLYRDVWVDRPQGLMVLYRIWNSIGLGSPVGVRILALLACLVGAAACGRIAAHLAGERAAWMSALAVGVFVSIPQLEGFIANAELLSCSVGAVALATLLRAVWNRPEPSIGGLALAGFFGGFALTIKQSGFDAVGAGVVAVIAMCLFGTWSKRNRALALPAFSLGFAVPIIVIAVHGALTGWERWWYAIVGYRTSSRSALKSADWSRLRLTGRIAAPILIVAIVLVPIIALWRARRRERAVVGLFAVWTLLAGVAFLLGGQFFRHYWVILLYPLGAMVGVASSLVPRRGWALAALGAMLIGPLGSGIYAMVIPRDEVGQRLSSDIRFLAAEDVGKWFESNKKPGENIYAYCNGTPLYGNISTDPPYPYLWFDGVVSIPGAREKLVEMMSGPKAPTYVAEFQNADDCDLSGAIRHVLDTRYQLVTTIRDVKVLRRSG